MYNVGQMFVFKYKSTECTDKKQQGLPKKGKTKQTKRRHYK